MDGDFDVLADAAMGHVVWESLLAPRCTGLAGDGAAMARQVDVVLMANGFKASRELLEHLSVIEPAAVLDYAVRLVRATRGYQRARPDPSVVREWLVTAPDTVDSWAHRMREALRHGGGDLPAALGSGWTGRSGYAELLAAHDDLLAPPRNQYIFVLGLSRYTLAEEIRRVWLPWADPDYRWDDAARTALAAACGDRGVSGALEHSKTIVNGVRLAAGQAPVGVTGVFDVLWLAMHASRADGSRRQFHGFRRAERRILLAALDAVVAADPGQLDDVVEWAGPWKRLGEVLHPGEYPRYPHAAELFAVARGSRTGRSVAARADRALAAGDPGAAAAILDETPELLLRSVDRLLRRADPDIDAVLAALERALGSVSGRLLCVLREHLANRTVPAPLRIFPPRPGCPSHRWVARDLREPLPRAVIDRAIALLDTELADRLSRHGRLVIDPVMVDMALPLSGKACDGGFAIVPRGSRSRVEGDVVRLFVTRPPASVDPGIDFELVLLDEDYQDVGRRAGGGAAGFVDIRLHTVEAAHVLVHARPRDGVTFNRTAESVFGWTTREESGDPDAAVARSDVRGACPEAYPVIFGRGPDGTWTATWLQLFVTAVGWTNFGVESHRIIMPMLLRDIVEREYLTVGHLVDLLRANGNPVTVGRPSGWTEPVTFVGPRPPADLPAGSTVLTLDRLNQLVPDPPGR